MSAPKPAWMDQATYDKLYNKDEPAVAEKKEDVKVEKKEVAAEKLVEKPQDQEARDEANVDVDKPVEGNAARSTDSHNPEQPRFKRRRRIDPEEARRRAEEHLRLEEQRKQHEEKVAEQKYATNNSDINNIVRQHYNQRAHVAQRQRRGLSPIIKLRHFNNAIKYMLINKFVGRGDVVLDLGCGKGGDLNKYSIAGVSQFIGIDISNHSIVEAINRYKKRSWEFKFEVVFITGDAFGTPLGELVTDFPQCKFPVDCVSMQFCLHYGFANEEKARTMVANIAKSLKTGGYFIGTIPNADYFRERLRKFSKDVEQPEWGNSVFNVKFDNNKYLQDGFEFDPPFGHQYTYYLKDAVDHVPEYVVPIEALRALGEEYGLELKYEKPFREIFKEEIPKWYKSLPRAIVEGITRPDRTLGISGDESEAVSDFYIAFAFVKKS